MQMLTEIFRLWSHNLQTRRRGVYLGRPLRTNSVPLWRCVRGRWGCHHNYRPVIEVWPCTARYLFRALLLRLSSEPTSDASDFVRLRWNQCTRCHKIGRPRYPNPTPGLS